jgi:hypothetical protein
MANTEDRLLSTNGAKVAPGGDWYYTETPLARVLRLLFLWKGHWAGQNPDEDPAGNEAWEYAENNVENEDTIATFMRLCVASLEPLVREGAIHTVEMRWEMRAQIGRVFILSWTSKTGKLNDIAFKSPWIMDE